jgi:hypothetical protein
VRASASELPAITVKPSTSSIKLLRHPANAGLYVTGLANGLYLALAWAFVLLRYAHSFIHVTRHRVAHRFTVCFAGTILLWVIWAMLGSELVMKATKFGG